MVTMDNLVEHFKNSSSYALEKAIEEMKKMQEDPHCSIVSNVLHTSINKCSVILNNRPNEDNTHE